MWQQQQQPPQRSFDPLRHVGSKEVAIKCFAEPVEEIENAGEAVLDKDGDGVSDDEVIGRDFPNGAAVSQRIPAAGDPISLGIREPVYEVILIYCFPVIFGYLTQLMKTGLSSALTAVVNL